VKIYRTRKDHKSKCISAEKPCGGAIALSFALLAAM
jgi:hypothetical protein